MSVKPKKCFYCHREGNNITIDEEGEMFFLCDKHIVMFRATYPKEVYGKKKNEE